MDRAGPASEARVGDHITAINPDRALVRPDQPDDLVCQGRLAGAVVAQQPVDLAGLDHQVDTVVGERRTSPVALGEPLDLE